MWIPKRLNEVMNPNHHHWVPKASYFKKVGDETRQPAEHDIHALNTEQDYIDNGCHKS